MSEERDVMEFDLLVVGAGPAGLSCAIHAKQLNPELNVCVLEKGATVGSHILAGAVIEPGPLEELLPNWKDNAPEVCVPVSRDEIRMMSAQGSIKFPIVPSQMNNHGNYIVSLSSLTQKMAEAAEELGVEIYPGFPARMPLYNEAGEVIGVRTGDMGVDKDGNPKDGYTPGMDLHAKLTVFAEGARGSCSKQLVAKYGLDAQADPQTYGIGIKELWQLPPGRTEPGLVMHTMGWPLDNKTYGGSFVYHLEDDKLAIGFVVGLDYEDPHLEPFEKFQEFKNHPHIKPLLEGGEIVSYGARAIVEGGWQSLPKMEMPGAALIGCGAGTLNVPKIKGVHQAIRSGMEIAKQFHEKASAEGFDARVREGAIGAELKRVRNIRPSFHWGMWVGLMISGLETLFAGLLPYTLRNRADHSALKKVSTHKPLTPGNRDLPPRDRLSAVYFAATEHDEDQPVHLRVEDTNICVTRCAEEYDNPCTRFCPAKVYEMVEVDGAKQLQINAANCVHCKTCDIKDPYQIINWVTPEGGSGPNYQLM